MAKDKTILLTFDVEEFDLPLEYGIAIDKERQLQITLKGLNAILSVLNEHNVRATFFVTAYFAECFPELIRHISENHEIASHMYYHSNHRSNDAANSRIKLTEITAKPVYGFRAPRLEAVPLKELRDAGYRYDSSLNPTYIPGRYNGFFKKRKIHSDATTGMRVVPMSVTPIFRIPLFWLSFKNMNYRLYLFFLQVELAARSVPALIFSSLGILRSKGLGYSAHRQKIFRQRPR